MFLPTSLHPFFGFFQCPGLYAVVVHLIKTVLVGRETTSPCIRLVVKQNGGNSHSPKHPNVPDILPFLFLSFVPRREGLVELLVMSTKWK